MRPNRKKYVLPYMIPDTSNIYYVLVENHFHSQWSAESIGNRPSSAEEVHHIDVLRHEKNLPRSFQADVGLKKYMINLENPSGVGLAEKIGYKCDLLR